MRIRAVCWDFGGVLVRTFDRSGRERWEQRLGLAPNDLERWVFNGEVSARASQGRATTADVWRRIGEQFSLSTSDTEALAHDFFSGDRADEELVRLIRSLRPFYLTALISNAWPGLRGWLTDVWGIADAFDQITSSAEVGMMKPEPPIYQHALRALGVLPGQAVFVDDFEENVAGARAVGMHALHFRTTDQAIEELQRLLAAHA